MVAFTPHAHADPVVLQSGELEAEVVVEANLASTYFAQPLSIAPDAWFGLTDRWTIGVVHSDPAIDRLGDGASVCVRTDEMDCTRRYHGGGADVRWSALTGELALAPRARLLVRDVDPWKPAVTLGALARWTHGALAITGDPYLQLGLANRDRGNRAQLVLPIEIARRLGCRWQIEARTGYQSELAVWRDGYHVPAWAGARFAATRELEIGAAVGFYGLLGPQGTPKERALFVTLRWQTMP